MPGFRPGSPPSVGVAYKAGLSLYSLAGEDMVSICDTNTQSCLQTRNEQVTLSPCRVEVWDGHGWSFTGAAEYNAEGLNHSWFVPYPASDQIKNDRLHAIYAARCDWCNGRVIHIHAYHVCVLHLYNEVLIWTAEPA